PVVPQPNGLACSVHLPQPRFAMALVDSLLKLLAAQGADVIVIPSTEPPWLERRGEPRPLSMPALGRDMVEAMVEDLLDQAQRERLAAGHGVETQYVADDGQAYAALVEPRADGPRLTLRRAGAEPAAQASPPTSGSVRPSTFATPPGSPGSSGPSSFPAAPPDAESDPAPEPPASTSTPPAANSAPALGGVTGSLEPLREDPVLDPGPLGPVLVRASHERASDILLSHGSNARLRVAGEIGELTGHAVDDDMLRTLLQPMLGARARHELHTTGSTDLALRVRTEGRVQRYRANLFLQQSGL